MTVGTVPNHNFLSSLLLFEETGSAGILTQLLKVSLDEAMAIRPKRWRQKLTLFVRNLTYLGGFHWRNRNRNHQNLNLTYLGEFWLEKYDGTPLPLLHLKISELQFSNDGDRVRGNDLTS